MSQLIALYGKVNGTEGNFEIIDISLDKQEREWKKYCTLIPWIRLPYNNNNRKQICTTLDILCKTNRYCISVIAIVVIGTPFVIVCGVQYAICSKGEVVTSG